MRRDFEQVMERTSATSPLHTQWLLDSKETLKQRLLMTIQLANDVEDYLRERLAAGPAANLDELANDLLRTICELQRQPLMIDKELEDWLLEAADEPTTPLTGDDFENLREKLRRRAKATQR